jgi:hypothetical protein
VIILFIKWILPITVILLLTPVNILQAVNIISITKLNITIYSDGKYNLEAAINTTEHFNYTLTFYGEYTYNKLFGIKIIQKPSPYNGKYELKFIFKKNSQKTYNGSIIEKNAYNSSFYIRKADYLVEYDQKYINVSKLSLKIVTNNTKYILYWNFTITALRLMGIHGKTSIKYNKLNNNYTLQVTITKTIYSLDELVKRHLSKIMFPGESYLSPWSLIGKINLISYDINADNAELVLNMQYSFKGLGLIVEDNKYIIPLVIALSNNGFKIINVPVGLVNNSFYTNIRWNTTVNNDKLYSRIHGIGYGLNINGMDRVKSIIYMVKKLFLKNSHDIVIYGGDLVFNINGTLISQINKTVLERINVNSIQYTIKTTTNTTESIHKNTSTSVLLGVSIIGLIISYIIYRIFLGKKTLKAK